MGVGDGAVWAWMEVEVKCPPNGKEYAAAGGVVVCTWGPVFISCQEGRRGGGT